MKIRIKDLKPGSVLGCDIGETFNIPLLAKGTVLTEEKIQNLEQEILEIEKLIQEHASDYVKLTELNDKREILQNELDILFEKWMELTDS